MNVRTPRHWSLVAVHSPVVKEFPESIVHRIRRGRGTRQSGDESGRVIDVLARRQHIGVVPERIAMQQAEGFGQPVQTVRTAGGREVAEIFDGYLTTLLRKG